MSMDGEAIYHRNDPGEEIRIDPRTLNLDELPLVLTMAGWFVAVSFAETDDGPIGIRLSDMGGSAGMTGIEIATALKMIDSDTGSLLPGYSVSEETGVIELGYQGVPDLRFAEFAKALFGLSPFEA